MNMIFINVSCYHRLNIITKILSDHRHSDPVSEFRRDVIIGRKTLYVMDRFHRSFALQRRKAVEVVPGELVVNEPHLIAGRFSIRHTVYGGRVEQRFGLVRVENVPQTFLDSSVDSDTFTVRDSSVTSFLRISTSSAYMLFVSFAFLAT